ARRAAPPTASRSTSTSNRSVTSPASGRTPCSPTAPSSRGTVCSASRTSAPVSSAARPSTPPGSTARPLRASPNSEFEGVSPGRSCPSQRCGWKPHGSSFRGPTERHAHLAGAFAGAYRAVHNGLGEAPLIPPRPEPRDGARDEHRENDSREYPRVSAPGQSEPRDPGAGGRWTFITWPHCAPSDLLGVRFAANVFIASAILWFLLVRVADTNPIWAIASMIAASEPQVREAVRMFRSRIINVLVGCAVGLLFLVVGVSGEWTLPLALAVTVLVSSYVVHIPTMWRQAPITAALVIAAGLTHHSKLSGIEHGLHKVGEVLLGCLIGLMVSFLMSKLWPMPEAGKSAGG